MRRLRRPALSEGLSRFLGEYQDLVDAGGDVRLLWSRARATLAMKRAAEALARMTGSRERCCWCLDSQAVDIEHYRPKLRYPGHAFRWENLLAACAPCNRAKLERFPLDARGEPLLIDPARENPWDFLFFDPATGNLVPRFRLDGSGDGEFDPKGAATLDALATLNHQAVVEGRLRACRLLGEAVRRFLAAPRGDGAVAELVEAIERVDDHGLLDWLLVSDGADVPPFSCLHREHPAVVAALRARWLEERPGLALP
jgi:hypothetical protein